MKSIILFDLDGTLADCQHRIHHISNGKKDWKAFFAACYDDEPIPHMIELMTNLSDHYDIWIVSGRSDECRVETEMWLKDNLPYGQATYDRLIMRKAGDYTGDDVLKVSWLDDGTIPKERVLMVFDDRKRVVDSWRARGVPCMHVADGNF